MSSCPFDCPTLTHFSLRLNMQGRKTNFRDTFGVFYYPHYLLSYLIFCHFFLEAKNFFGVQIKSTLISKILHLAKCFLHNQ